MNQGRLVKVLRPYPLANHIIEAGVYEMDSPALEGCGNWLIALGIAELVPQVIQDKKGKK